MSGHDAACIGLGLVLGAAMAVTGAPWLAMVVGLVLLVVGLLAGV